MLKTIEKVYKIFKKEKLVNLEVNLKERMNLHFQHSKKINNKLKKNFIYLRWIQDIQYYMIIVLNMQKARVAQIC